MEVGRRIDVDGCDSPSQMSPRMLCSSIDEPSSAGKLKPASVPSTGGNVALGTSMHMRMSSGITATGAGMPSSGLTLGVSPSAQLADDLKHSASLELKQRKYVKYRECLKNHAASIGGHATDGCGEFMPSGEEGTLEALTCAACHCHRNFHRREVEGETLPLSSPSSMCADCRFHGFNDRKRIDALLPSPLPLPAPHPLLSPPPHMVMAFNPGVGMPDPEDYEVGSGFYTPPHGAVASFKKRFRTKFTPEQKEQMASFAQKLGWRIQKQDEEAVQQFCAEVGVKRHVLKVWMHNNKLTMGTRQPMPSETPIHFFACNGL